VQNIFNAEIQVNDTFSILFLETQTKIFSQAEMVLLVRKYQLITNVVEFYLPNN